MEWFTADPHLGHKNVIKYCNRPFNTVEEMDETIINNCLEVLKPKDTLNILGDFAWHKPIAERALHAIKETGAKIRFIWGGHDKQIQNIIRRYADYTGTLETITIENQPIVLCHYALRVWDRKHYGAWNLYGHSHGNLEDTELQIDVGVDSHGYKPVSFERIKEIIKQRDGGLV